MCIISILASEAGDGERANQELPPAKRLAVQSSRTTLPPSSFLGHLLYRKHRTPPSSLALMLPCIPSSADASHSSQDLLDVAPLELRTWNRDTQGDDTSDRSTNESFHPIARIRKTRLSPHYSPAALAGYVVQGPSDDYCGQAGWQWIKNRILPSVPEYVLCPDKKMTVMHNLDYVTRSSLSRALCQKSLLADLDRDNGIPILRSDMTTTQ